MTGSLLLNAYLLGWAVAAPIGPVNLEIIRRGLRYRILAGFMVGVGATMIDLGYMLGVGFGLTRLFQYRLFLLASLSIGCLLMAWLAWGALREAWHEWRKLHPGSSDAPEAASDALSRPSMTAVPTEPPRLLLKCWLTGLGMTASNPMTIVFWATLPNLLYKGQTPTTTQVLLASAGVWLGTISWVSFLMVVLATGRRLVGPRLFAIASGLGGLAMAYFAVRFAWMALHVDDLMARVGGSIGA